MRLDDYNVHASAAELRGRHVIGKSVYPYADSRKPDYERVPSFMRTGTDPFP